MNDPGCMEIGKNNQFLQTCSSPSDASCRTQEQWVDFDVLGQKSSMRVIRQCATNQYDVDRPCYYRTGFGGKTNVCNCQGDGCNEAPRTTASLLLMVLGLYLLKKLF
ncbi:uncharacterized protein LOC129223294 [Uloborus diversus]|uniref:uncharacterized protein LOC129223294 n=1 Tax=Uloborus diversus TaxID=327109 RepID=UPI002409FF61|nr:uncharacterized protein LOC129223294 [Uloborus diversus]